MFFSKTKVIITMVLLLSVLYVIAFIYQYNTVPKPVVQYFKAGDKVEYCGFEYTFSEASVYTEKELIEKFHLDEDSFMTFAMSKRYGYEYRYLVTQVAVKRIDKETAAPSYLSLVNRYMQTGYADDIVGAIQPADYIPPQQLKVGEESRRYEVMYVPKMHVDKSIWNQFEKQKFYVEFKDCEGHEFLSWIKILN